jgi:hypothetical protein
LFFGKASKPLISSTKNADYEKRVAGLAHDLPSFTHSSCNGRFPRGLWPSIVGKLEITGTSSLRNHPFKIYLVNSHVFLGSALMWAVRNSDTLLISPSDGPIKHLAAEPALNQLAKRQAPSTCSVGWIPSFLRD